MCGSELGARRRWQAAAVEERRLAAVLFADLSGFTALSEEMDSEDVHIMLDRSMKRLGVVVERYGGYVDNVIGDALMAVFGAPLAHGDDSERAVRAALEMQRCARDDAACFGGLPLRIAVNTGVVTFAPLGPDAQRHFTVIGDTVNTAARLQAAAPTSGVLVGEQTYRATRRAVRYRRVDPVLAKGKKAPVQAWVAVGTGLAPGERPPSTTPLVGRKAELRVLLDLWDEAVREKRPQCVLLSGPPGIGKSRLAQELTRAVDLPGGRFFVCQSLPYGKSAGYGAFGQLVRDVAGVFETDRATEAREKLKSRLGELLGEEASRSASRLAILAGLGNVHEDPDRDTLFSAARSLVQALGKQGPSLLIFDNVQWAEPSLLDLLASFAHGLAQASVMIVALARPELREGRGWTAWERAYRLLELEPLSGSDMIELLGLLLPAASQNGVEADVGRADIQRVSGGNPLFIEELVASLLEGVTDVGKDLPPNIGEIIAARLDALPAHEREIVLHASVVGEEFWAGALGRRGATEEAIDSLLRRNIIRVAPTSRIEDETQYCFKHTLVRDIAYGTLPKSERRWRHRAVAEYLEQRTHGVGESSGTLAHHWLEAGEPGLAVDYLLVAGEQARKGRAKEEAVRLCKHALELVPPDDERRRRRARLAWYLAAATLGTRDMHLSRESQPG